MADENKNLEEQNVDNSKENKTPTIEELSEQIAKLTAELATANATAEKNKAALDKALKDKGELTKSLRAKQTAEEQAEEAKKEQEEAFNQRVQELENFQKMALAKDRYLMQGMSADLASKAAEAEVQGNMDTLATIQKQHTDAMLKNAKAEWQKSRDDINAGTDDNSTITKEQFDAMSIEAKSKLYKENKAEYDRLNS